MIIIIIIDDYICKFIIVGRVGLRCEMVCGGGTWSQPPSDVLCTVTCTVATVHSTVPAVNLWTMCQLTCVSCA